MNESNKWTTVEVMRIIQDHDEGEGKKGSNTTSNVNRFQEMKTTTSNKIAVWIIGPVQQANRARIEVSVTTAVATI